MNGAIKGLELLNQRQFWLVWGAQKTPEINRLDLDWKTAGETRSLAKRRSYAHCQTVAPLLLLITAYYETEQNILLPAAGEVWRP